MSRTSSSAPPPSYRARARVTVAASLLRIREVDKLVLRVSRVQGDVHQTRKDSAGIHLRYAGDRRWIQHAPANDPKAAGTLSDQDVEIGQHGKRPRVIHALDGGHANQLPSGIEDLRLVRQPFAGRRWTRISWRLRRLLRGQRCNRYNHNECWNRQPTDHERPPEFL